MWFGCLSVFALAILVQSEPSPYFSAAIFQSESPFATTYLLTAAAAAAGAGDAGAVAAGAGVVVVVGAGAAGVGAAAGAGAVAAGAGAAGFAGAT